MPAAFMLNDDQRKYLASIPKDQIVHIYSFDKASVEKITDSIIDRVRSSISEVWPIKFIGASALGISGQKDIDAYILCPVGEFKLYLPALTKEFGNPKPWYVGQTSIVWNWEEDGYNIELYLTDPDSPATQEQLKVFELLKDNPKLLTEYEQLKQIFDGKSYHDYQKAKYEFYNRILNTA